MPQENAVEKSNLTRNRVNSSIRINSSAVSEKNVMLIVTAMCSVVYHIKFGNIHIETIDKFHCF